MLYGSHYLLTVLPIWVTALILYAVTLGAIFILRDKKEGLFYNTSYSAMIGDGALIVVVLLSAGILQRGQVIIPPPLQDGRDHILIAIISIGVGIVWLRLDRPRQWGDRYHHGFIAPLFVYLIFTLLPIIVLYGDRFEMVSTICLVVLWAVLVVYDAKTGRLDQRNYRGLGDHLDAIKNYPINPR